jgi:hypothetical protein
MALKAGAVLLATSDNQVFMVSSEFATREISMEAPSDGSALQICKSLLFETNKQLHVSFGFSNGAFVAEPIKSLVQDGVKESVLIQTKQVTGRVTMLKYLPLFNLLAVGSASGEILLHNIAKNRPYQYFDF